MKENNVKNIVFSSSATVYGDPQYLPLDEKHPVGGCTNPYGKTKYFIEEILSDVCKADKVSKVNRFANRCAQIEPGNCWYFIHHESVIGPVLENYNFPCC